MKSFKFSSKQFAALGILVVSALALPGCASIVHSGDRKITIDSDPHGAKITVSKAGQTDAVATGVTPLTVQLSPKKGYLKGQEYLVTIEMAGYKTAEVALKPEISNWYVGNVLFGGELGLLVVDPLSSSMWNLNPEKVQHKLTSDQAKLVKEKNGFIVTLLSDLPPEEQERVRRSSENLVPNVKSQKND